MPGRDGTGPYLQGSMAGRGLGYCQINRKPFRGTGFGRGFGLGYGRGYIRTTSDKNALRAEKENLMKRINEIDKELNK